MMLLNFRHVSVVPAILPGGISGGMDHRDVRMSLGERHGVFLHVAGSEEDHLSALTDQVIRELLGGHVWPVRRVGLVDVDHARAGQVLFYEEAALVVGLAPARVVARAHQHHAEDELLHGPADGGERGRGRFRDRGRRSGRWRGRVRSRDRESSGEIAPGLAAGGDQHTHKGQQDHKCAADEDAVLSRCGHSPRGR